MKRRKVTWCVSFAAWVFLAAVCAPAASQQWVLDPASGLGAPEARGYHGASAVFDASTNRMIIFAGRKSTGDNLNDVWALTNANGLGGTPQWINLITDGSAGSPFARSGHSAVYDATDNRMIVFGGCNGFCLPALNDVWVLTDANGVGGTPAWTELFPVGGPPQARTQQTAIYDEGNNRMIIFGGSDGGGSGGTFSDVWVLSNANGIGGTPTWTQLSPIGGRPQGRTGASAVYDALNNIMTVFGGRTNITGNVTNAVWTLSNANGLGGTPVWTNTVANGATGSPFRRVFHTAVYDPGSNRMTIFGGDNNIAGLNDAWVLSNANGLGGSSVWTRLAPAGTKPLPRYTLPSVYDATTNRMIIFSGTNSDASFNGAWVLTDANGL